MPGLALLVLSQFLEPTPVVAEVGAPVAVRAVGRDGAPLVGLEVRVRPLLEPAASPALIGATGSDGIVRFVPQAAGDYELRARLPQRGPLLAASVRVVAPPRRWLWAAVCLPLGLWFLWRHTRRPTPA
jgi:hypothetical protein